MPTITRKLEWDSGHRVLGHEGKCRNLHGHRYVAEVTVWSAGLDHVGRVIDFGLVKKIIGGWIDENWDHNMLLNSNDPLALEDDEARLCLVGREPFLMPKESNPTAEVMVEVLFKTAEILLPQYLVVKKVRLYETPNCYAEYPSE